MASSHGKSDMQFADWMASLPNRIHRVPLTSLAIPGSHDSFSFHIDESSPVGPEQPETVQNFVSVFGTVAKKLMRKWLATQTMNFTNQMEAGVRYFDLRISTKPRDPDNELYFAHGLFSAKVNEGLKEINTFLSSHSKEVVFLDFNHFYGMQKYHHENLVQMLKDIFGNKMCPAIFAQEVSLHYLWERNYQVLVFYHSPVALEVPFLWPGQMMPAPWANTTDTEKLIQFLQSSITERRRKGTFFISQVVLTPKASTVVKGVTSGLRETITESFIPSDRCLEVGRLLICERDEDLFGRLNSGSFCSAFNKCGTQQVTSNS
uniref:Phosphatidylinositol specific phospholipase C X domain containing 3 n=1 Tax=Leptobrachium leishanense TaxID=445787 RepID=A0A8C5LRF7_9ANUR